MNDIARLAIALVPCVVGTLATASLTDGVVCAPIQALLSVVVGSYCGLSADARRVAWERRKRQT